MYIGVVSQTPYKVPSNTTLNCFQFISLKIKNQTMKEEFAEK